MDWMFLPYKRYADFQGRSRRQEYWMFALFTFLVGIGFDTLLFSIGGGLGRAPNAIGILLSLLLFVFSLGSIVPSLAVSVRRLHDQDKSGWFLLLGLIPLLGGIILIVLMCLDGTSGSNRFGDDPKAAPAEVF